MSEIKQNSNKSNKNKGLEINNIGINSDIIRRDIEKSYMVYTNKFVDNFSRYQNSILILP